MGGFDWTLGVGRIVAMDVKGERKILVANIEGIDGETSNNQLFYGALGVVSRALPADTNGAVEPIYARTEDGLLPLAVRDPRLNAKTNPKAGEVMLVGYHGGFVSLKPNADNDGTDFVAYAPKADGSKASVISIDTTDANSSITIMHDSGVSVQLADGKILLMNRNGDAYIEIGDSGIVLNGNVRVTGSMSVGPTPVAVMLGTNTPASTLAAT